jgi:hypothetical protein
MVDNVKCPSVADTVGAESVRLGKRDMIHLRRLTVTLATLNSEYLFPST